jgi:hypothetical protein
LKLKNRDLTAEAEEAAANRRSIGPSVSKLWTVNHPTATNFTWPQIAEPDVDLIADRPRFIGPQYRGVFVSSSGAIADAAVHERVRLKLRLIAELMDAKPSQAVEWSEKSVTAERAFVPYGTISALVFATASFVTGITLGLTHAIGTLQGLTLVVAGLGLGSSSVAYLATMERAGRRAGLRTSE